MTKAKLSLLLLAAAAAALAGGCSRRSVEPSPLPSSRRMTTEGPIVGVQGRYGDTSWLGVPFAEPPVDGLRWREPIAPRPRNGEYLATKLPPRCPQIASPFGGISDVAAGEPTGQEDCLYLNIYTPPDLRPDTAEPLPVLLWIHGGGNVIGHAGFYDGGNLAVTENVIVVVVQYRLGPFGWFRHSALRNTTSGLAVSGNFGTLDQIRALEWVRDNIAFFGGDPDRVTVFGESAGARNAIALLLSPPARGLFHGAIAQSGGTWLVDPAAAENFADAVEPGDRNSSNEILLRLLVADGTATDAARARVHVEALDDAELAGYLRSKTPEEMLAAYGGGRGNGLIDVPNVFADGTVVSSGDPLENLASGNAADVPAIFGTNRDENKIFMFADPAWVKRWFGILPRLRDPDLYNATAEALAGLWAISGAIEPAAARHRNGGAATYLYRWDWDEEPTVLGADLAEMIGAAHAMEIPFIFGHFDLGPEGNMIFTGDNQPGRHALSRHMMAYWANFARTGSPGGDGGERPAWRRFDPSRNTETVLVLDTAAGGGIRHTDERPDRDLILGAIENDPRIQGSDSRCLGYQALHDWGRALTRAELGDRGCASTQ